MEKYEKDEIFLIRKFMRQFKTKQIVRTIKLNLLRLKTLYRKELWRLTAHGLQTNMQRVIRENCYYGGCEYVDVVETLAIERAKEIIR